MARLDKQSLYQARKIKALQRCAAHSALQRYHHQKAFYDSGLTTREDKAIFVEKHPFIAAELFYHRHDHKMGELLVKTYKSHPQDDLRELAESVRDVLRVWQAKNARLVVVLGMQIVPVLEDLYPEENSYLDEAYIDLAGRFAESIAEHSAR